MNDYTLEDSVYLLFTTRAFGTGIPGTLSASTVSVYEDVTATPVLDDVAVTESLNSVAGLNAVTIPALSASGFNALGTYHVVIKTGTVDSVSVVGEVVGSFTLSRSAAAVVGGTIKAETALIVQDTNELQQDDVPGLIAALDVVVDTVKAETALIVQDTGTTIPGTLTTMQGNVTDLLADTGTAGVAISATTANEIADALLTRDWNSVTGEAARSALNALRFLRNKYSISGTTLTVTQEDDATSAWTSTLTTDAAADPVTGSDPA